MGRSSKIATLVIAATIAAVLLNPLASTVSQSTGTQTVTNESVTADDTWQELQGYSIDESTVSVTDTSGNTVNATYYDVQPDPGQIRINGSASTTLTDGEEALVSYDYQASDSTTTIVAGLVPLFAVLLILVTLAAKVQGMM